MKKIDQAFISLVLPMDIEIINMAFSVSEDWLSCHNELSFRV